MLRLALTMLVNERGKYIGIIAALSFTAFMMVQQPAIFLGILARSTSVITDLPIVDLWVMDPKVENVDDAKPLPDSQLYRVKSIAGVQWAVPFYRGSIKARLADGNFLVCQLIGIDDVTLIGGPNDISAGTLTDLRGSDAIFVDEASARGRLAGDAAGGGSVGLGATLELNDKRATIVGLHRGPPSFQSQPVIYTTYNRVKAFLPSERKLLSYILVKLEHPADAPRVAADIAKYTGLAAYTSAQFRQISSDYFLFRSGIFLNFAVSAVIAFAVGGGIAGQTFYNFTLDNIRYFGVLKAMGARRGLLVAMILLQAATVGAIGFGIGAGGVALFSEASGGSPIVMSINPLVLGASFAIVLLVILGAAAFSARPVLHLEPAAVFRG